MTDSTSARTQALDAFRASGSAHLNCAQSVLLYALSMLDSDPAATDYGRYFGGGIGRLGMTCGALTGAALSLGARDRALGLGPDAQKHGYQALQELVRAFEREFGATSCRDLTGCDLSTREGYRRFKDERIAREKCESYVDWVCTQLEDVLTSST